MKFQYTITLADYKAAIALHNRQSLIRRIGHAYIFILLPIFMALGLVTIAVLDFSRAKIVFLSGDYGFVFIIILLLPVIRSFFIRMQFNRLFPLSQTDRNLSFDINDDYIYSIVPGISEGKFYWNANVAFAQDKKVTLVYVNKRRFVLIPTRSLSKIQSTELRDLVERNKVRSKK